jgi:hypothetical protein
MPFSISNLTRHLTEEIKNPAIHFGKIQRRLPEIQLNLTKQFLGVRVEAFTFDLYDEQAEEEEIPNFSSLSTIAESRQSHGARILDYIAHGIAQRLENKFTGVNQHNPAILTAAYEIAAHIGMEDFHHIAERVASESGIHVQHEPDRSIDISISSEGAIDIRRYAHWYDTVIDKKSSGEFAAEWVLTCLLEKNPAGHLVLSASITEISLLLRDTQVEGENVNALASAGLPSSRFNRFVNRFRELIHSTAEHLNPSDVDVQLSLITAHSKPSNHAHASLHSAWHGWRATRETVSTQLRLEKTSPSTARIFLPKSLPFGHDRAMAWHSDASQVYMDNKFRFIYSSKDLSIEAKLKEEDSFALDVLESDSIKTVVLDISKQLANYLENAVPPDNRNNVIDVFHAFVQKYLGLYPFSKQDIPNFDALVHFFRTHEDHIAILSLVWPIFSNTLLRDSGIDNIDHLYKTKIYDTKVHNIDHTKFVTLDVNDFGNSKTLTCDFFTGDAFHPFKRSIDYISHQPDIDNKVLKRMDVQRIPYISGLSGMANLTCKLLHALYIHPHSDIGKKFCEAMSAFIVGSGMHSYYETYKSFNLYARSLDQDIKIGLFV